MHAGRRNSWCTPIWRHHLQCMKVTVVMSQSVSLSFSKGLRHLNQSPTLRNFAMVIRIEHMATPAPPKVLSKLNVPSCAWKHHQLCPKGSCSCVSHLGTSTWACCSWLSLSLSDRALSLCPWQGTSPWSSYLCPFLSWLLVLPLPRFGETTKRPPLIK